MNIRAKLDETEQDIDRIVTCHGCVHLDTDDCESGVGWCNFHWQYRSIGTPRTCEGAQFFN